MAKLDQLDEIFRYLFAGLPASVERRQAPPEQCEQLLSAFHKIEDHRLRQELVLLVEIVSLMPEVLQQRRGRPGTRLLAQAH